MPHNVDKAWDTILQLPCDFSHLSTLDELTDSVCKCAEILHERLGERSRVGTLVGLKVARSGGDVLNSRQVLVQLAHEAEDSAPSWLSRVPSRQDKSGTLADLVTRDDVTIGNGPPRV